MYNIKRASHARQHSLRCSPRFCVVLRELSTNRIMGIFWSRDELDRCCCDVKLCIIGSKRLEALLTDHFNATGRGLHEKISSTNALPEPVRYYWRRVESSISGGCFFAFSFMMLEYAEFRPAKKKTRTYLGILNQR